MSEALAAAGKALLRKIAADTVTDREKRSKLLIAFGSVIAALLAAMLLPFAVIYAIFASEPPSFEVNFDEAAFLSRLTPEQQSQLEDMEKAYTWTGDIALATKSEYIRAHGNTDCSNAKYLSDNRNTCKTTNYLHKSSYLYWLLSPYSSYAHYEFCANRGDVLGTYARTQTGSVRPVLHLKSNIKLTGNGGQSSEDMYKIVR